MKQIDKQYMNTSFYGVLRMIEHLKSLGYAVKVKRIRRLYRLMDLHAICPLPNISRPHKGAGHSIFPYLLRGLTAKYAKHIWAVDISYIPLLIYYSV
ncbi:MAG: hypothetical protein ACK5MG_04730 [Bacteroidales bacterium]